MTEELRELEFKAGQRRVERLMRENGIVAIRTRKYKATTDSNHTLAVAPNLLDRDFSATAPNRKLAGDITYT
jgi:transposase InsO family protein